MIQNNYECYWINGVSVGVPAGANDLVKVPAGKAVLGKPASFPGYGWDNEYGELEIEWVFRSGLSKHQGMR